MKFKYLLILVILVTNIKDAGSNMFSDFIWIEDIPIFSKVIINKKDAIEFDSSDGKIIIIHIDSNKSLTSELFKFYNKFFKERKWINKKRTKLGRKDIEITKKTFRSKVVNSTLVLKIITQNF